ncbi:MAG TPA: deoxyribodipyrimidine photo-lyase [Candidatus Acidoferrales bacterium]|nr:deoxyribodipyrimidine photo-lyase [Candidatus Acidoferrales bacterium]
MTTSLFWFLRDLRLHDNPALSAAVASSDRVYAVFCTQTMDQLNERQRKFATAALARLRTAVGKSDASLSLLGGDPAAALEEAARRLNATAVFCARPFDRLECGLVESARKRLASAGIGFRTLGAGVVHEPEAVAERKQAEGEGYRVFPPFYRAWKAVEVPRPLASVAPTGRDAQAGPLPEGIGESDGPDASEAAALETLSRFVSARAADYGANAEFPGRAATSTLAPYLRFGLVSPRTVYHAIAERMVRSWTLAQERLSMSAFLRRLALRDFYIHLAFFWPDVYDEPLQQKMAGFPASHDERFVNAWTQGLTGYPLVDAAMRQLRMRGQVHGRAAVVAASFCTADLGLDWRIGRDVWMRELLEADEALCVGNWQRIAGIGSDQASYPRIYNPVRQAQLFDPQATYVRRWCTELAKLPTRAALAPWAVGEAQQTELGFFTPAQYPRPIVDHEAAARAYLARYQAYRAKAFA